MGIQFRIEALRWRIEEDSQKSGGRAEVGMVFLGVGGQGKEIPDFQRELSQSRRGGIKDTKVFYLAFWLR